MNAEGGLSGNTEKDKKPIIATGLDHEVPTPEMNENYVNAAVVLPIGNTYARGKVVGWKRCADGNAVERGNYKPILDTREYRVEFDGG